MPLIESGDKPAAAVVGAHREAVRPHVVVDESRTHDVRAGQPTLLLIPRKNRERDVAVGRSIICRRGEREAAKHPRQGLHASVVPLADLHLHLETTKFHDATHVVVDSLFVVGDVRMFRQRSPVTTRPFAEGGDVALDGDRTVRVLPKQLDERVGELVVAGHDVSFEAGWLGDEPRSFLKHDR